MTLKEEMKKTWDDSMMTEEEVTEMVKKVKEAFKKEQKQFKTGKYSLICDFVHTDQPAVRRGFFEIYPIGPEIKSTEKRQWLFRKLQEKLESEGIEVRHEFEEIEGVKEKKDYTKKIIKSYYTINLWS